jgi:uncharacterized protein (TIGR02145 family)
MKRIISIMLFLPLLMTACKNDTEVDNPDSTPITLLANIGSIGVETRGSGVIDDSYASNLDVNFARIDQGDNGAYPENDTYPLSPYFASTALAATRAAGSGNRSITFATPQTYSLYNSKFVGWYPRAAMTSGAVNFTVDGSTDIMLTNEVEGSSSSTFNSGENKTFTFAHQLTQLQLKVYAESNKAVTDWGTITSIKVTNQQTQCNVILPDRVSFVDGAESNVAFTGVTSAALPVGSTVNSGYVMIPEVAASGTLTLEIVTTLGGTKNVTLTAPATGGLAKSNAYVYTLKFTQTSISVVGTAQVGEWITAATNNYEVDASTGALNLSSNGTANSYIARPNGVYKFNATVMGNGATTAASTIVSASNGTQSATAIVPSTLAPTAAFVVWETGNTSGSVIESGSLSLANGYVTFRTTSTSTPGNAVIAVTDGTNILWSWHIWKVNYNPNVEYDTYSRYPAGSSTFKMMKYNLGATEISNWSGTATNAGDMGLFYQWGRKDPFVGAAGWSGNTPVPVTYASGYANGTTANSTAGADASASLVYAVKNPTKFILGNSSTFDWLNASDYTAQRDNLWGNPNATATQPNPERGSKSIYDPCPPGWRVPSQESFRIFAEDGDNDGTVNGVSGWVNGYTFYTQSYQSGSTSYWPALGYYWDGVLSDLGTNGYYWHSSSNADVSASNMVFSDRYIAPMVGNGRSAGFAVRCAQE